MRKTTVVGLAGLLMLTLGACGSEDGRGSSDSTAGGEPLQRLAESYATEMEPDRLEATHDQFRALSASELDLFNEASEKIEASRLEALHAGNDSATNLEPLKAQLRAATKMRKEINRLSMQQYGKPYNQLDGAEIDRLFPLLKGDYAELGIAAAATGEPSLTAAAPACDPGSYPLTARASGPTWRLGTGWARYYENRVNGQSDCDLVYAYQGTFTRMRTVLPKDVTLLAWLGGATAMRHTGYSDIVLGTGKVWAIYGHPSLVTLRMY